MSHIDPIGGTRDPSLLRAWQQATLEQQVTERQQQVSRRRRAYEQAQAEAESADGFRQGDHGFLRTLQGNLRALLDKVGSAGALSERIAQSLRRAPPETRTVLHAAVLAHPADLGRAIFWVVEHLDRPHLVAHECAQLGPALGAVLGPARNHLDAFGLTLIDVLNAATEPAGSEWSDAWDLVARWLKPNLDQDPVWTGEVVAHDRRRDEIAVVHVRSYLPYAYLPGQPVAVATRHRPDEWQKLWIASLPADDNVIEVHVQVFDRVTEDLVKRTAVGDPIWLRRAGGGLPLPPPSEHALLMVAGGVGIAPMKALLTQLRQDGDERLVHLFWGVRQRDGLYDLEAVRSLGATVVPAVAEGPAYPYRSGALPNVVVDHGDWRANDVLIAGSPQMVSGTIDVLTAHGVPREHISAGDL
jgi:NAD(P)H-flavin reductase